MKASGTIEAARAIQNSARAAGLFYLITIVTGLYAQLFTRMALIHPHDASATASAITAHMSVYRSGLAADLLMLVSYIVVTVLLYSLFSAGGRRLSAIAAGFSMVGIAVLAMTSVLHAVPIMMSGHGGMAGPDTDMIDLLALRLHGWGYGISLVFFGCYCVTVGLLAIRSRRVPWAVGALMILGGLVHIADQYFGILLPELSDILPQPVLMLPLLGEAALALWLLIFAVRVEQSPERSEITS